MDFYFSFLTVSYVDSSNTFAPPTLGLTLFSVKILFDLVHCKVLGAMLSLTHF